MRRTASGDDIARSSLFSKASATPYVYMQALDTSSPMSPVGVPKENGTTAFQRHVAGATVHQLHTSNGLSFPLPSGFMIEVSGGYLHATSVPLNEPIFTLPIVSVSRVAVLRATGRDVPWTHLFCGCTDIMGSKIRAAAATALWSRPVGSTTPLSHAGCFGENDVALALDLDAPVGWLQYGSGGCAGPVRLTLYIRDVDEWIDAMGIHLLLAP